MDVRIARGMMTFDCRWCGHHVEVAIGDIAPICAVRSRGIGEASCEPPVIALGRGRKRR